MLPYFVTNSVALASLPTSSAPASPQKITLTSIGSYVQLTPTRLNFGNQPVGTKSLSKRITLSNKGSIAVSITGISIRGTLDLSLLPPIVGGVDDHFEIVVQISGNIPSQLPPQFCLDRSRRKQCQSTRRA